MPTSRPRPGPAYLTDQSVPPVEASNRDRRHVPGLDRLRLRSVDPVTNTPLESEATAMQPVGPGPDRSSAHDLARAGPGQSAGRGTPKSPGLLRMKPLSLAM